MRFIWAHIFRWRAYRYARADARLVIEIRFALARTLREKRRRLGVTQAQLARRIGAAPATISRVELASPHVAMDIFVRAMIALGANTAEIAVAFDADSRADIHMLRRRIGPRTRIPPRPRSTQRFDLIVDALEARMRADTVE
jgi:transcriptional regulator with XRE-family HTH domain